MTQSVDDSESASTREEQLPWAHSRFESFLDSITDRFFGFSKDWRFVYLNSRAAEQMQALGKDPQRLIGKLLWDEFDNVLNESALRRVMSERVPLTDELYYSTLGEWHENHIYPGPDGGLVVLQRDITRPRQQLEKLQKCADYLNEAERLSHVATWALNLVTGDLFWSPEHFRICGVDPDQFTPTRESVRSLIHPDDRETAREAFTRGVREKQDSQWDVRFVRPDGSIRFVHCLGRPRLDDAGVLTDYVGTIIDTTEEKRIEQERMQLVRRAVAAQEEERRRIAREMHDRLGERLSALAINLAFFKQQLRDQPAAAAQLENLEHIVKQLDADVSFLVWELRPTALDDLGLAVALVTYVKGWAKHYAIEAQARISGLEKERLTAESETALYRITQEALTNIAKHADATHVSVILEHRRDHVFLMVEDDGIGFDAARPVGHDESTWGLVGMRERAELAGGSLELESRPGRGVTVVARIPSPSSLASEDSRA